MHARTVCVLAVGVIAASVSAFAPVAQAPLHSARRSSAPRCALTGDDTTDRRAVLAGLLGVALGVGGRPVSAGYVTSLGIETTKPADADRDDELLASKAVQDTIANIKGYKVSAATLKSLFSKDGNMPLIPVIRKEFDFSKVCLSLAHAPPSASQPRTQSWLPGPCTGTSMWGAALALRAERHSGPAGAE